MRMKISIKEFSTKTIMDEMKSRYPVGFIAGYITDDPSEGNGSYSDTFYLYGSQSVKVGLASELTALLEMGPFDV